MKRPCIDRPCSFTTTGTRCSTHQAEYERKRGTRQQRGLGADHDAMRAQVLQEAGADIHGIGGHCEVCGGPGVPDDPLTADHIRARDNGGTNVRENYRATHRSYNSSRGAGPGGGCATQVPEHRTPRHLARGVYGSGRSEALV